MRRTRAAGDRGHERSFECHDLRIDAAALLLCPACGFHDPSAPQPWKDGSASDEICPSCGLQFGYHDAVAKGDPASLLYHGWRSCWIEHGAPWSSVGRQPPPGWNPRAQVQELLSLTLPTLLKPDLELP